MTLNRFFKEMRTLRGRFEVDGCGEIRTKKERATYGGYKCLCPIEELYRAKTKKLFNGSLSSAEEWLGLSKRDANLIINAADDGFVKYRKPLLRALGL